MRLSKCVTAPIVSSALGGCMESGSTQHSRRAQGEIMSTSGGSTPMLRHSTSATAVVFSRSFWRHLDTRLCACAGASSSSRPASCHTWAARADLRTVS